MNQVSDDESTITKLREDAIREHEDHLERTKHSSEIAIQYSSSAIRLIFLMNGGAAVAVLAFLSSSAELANEPTAAVRALTCFASGVVAAACASAGSYFSQTAFTLSLRNYEMSWDHPYTRPTSVSEKFATLGVLFQAASVLIAFGAIAFFVAGVWALRSGFLGIH